MPHILVVEDDEDIRELLHTRLTMMNHQVMSTGSAAEAFTALDDHVPDVVILDIVMPQLNGLDLLGQLRRDPRYTALPVIVLTARLLSSDPTAATALDARYLNKPIVVSDLADAVALALRPLGLSVASA